MILLLFRMTPLISMDNFRPLAVLGRGHFGKVSLVKAYVCNRQSFMMNKSKLVTSDNIFFNNTL